VQPASVHTVFATRTPKRDLIAAIIGLMLEHRGILHGSHATQLPVLEIAIGLDVCQNLAHFHLDFIDDLLTRTQLTRTARLGGLEANRHRLVCTFTVPLWRGVLPIAPKAIERVTELCVDLNALAGGISRTGEAVEDEEEQDCIRA
jgi:hypothetical protein